MKNYIQPGKILTLPTTQNTQSGEAFSIGAIQGVAVRNQEDGFVEVCTEGVFLLPKDKTEEHAVGDLLYLKGKSVTKKAEANALVFGAAVKAAKQGEEKVEVKLKCF